MKINVILLIIIVISVIGLASLGLYFYQENADLKRALISEKIDDWNLYANDELGFKIRYPKDWAIEEAEAIGLPVILFWPAGPRAEPNPVSIGIYEGACISDENNSKYERYISESAFGPNMQYELHTKERISTINGLEGARITWLTRTWEENLKLESCLPTIVFENCGVERVVLIDLGDKDYFDTYNTMIQTFEWQDL